MRIVQISDSHLSMDKPARLAELAACIDHINELDVQPDAVVHTGDVTHNGLPQEYEAAQRILAELNAPWFVMMGNRDKRENFIRAFAAGRFIRRDMAFVQYAVDLKDVRLIIGDTASTKGNKGQLCEVRRAEIADMLNEECNKPALIFLHHPPFLVTVGPEPKNFQDWSEAEAIVALFKQQVALRGILCGHVHRTFDTTVGIVPAHVLSCIASDLRWDDLPLGRAPIAIFDI